MYPVSQLLPSGSRARNPLERSAVRHRRGRTAGRRTFPTKDQAWPDSARTLGPAMKRVLVTGATRLRGTPCDAPARRARMGGARRLVARRRDADDGVIWHRADLLDPEQLSAVVAARRSHASAPPRLVHGARPVGGGPGELRLGSSQPRAPRWRFARTEAQRIVTAGSCLEYDWSVRLLLGSTDAAALRTRPTASARTRSSC